ncbi:MAG TPA: hypothetical protein GX738_03055 [Firmicutes bacterium]|nr:hypothetical protein [Bacillota bacterium]
MKRLSVFHSRCGAAALAAALYYSYGPTGEGELMANLRHLKDIGNKPRAFVASDEAVLAVADGNRPLVLQKAICNVVGCLRPQVEIVFYPQEETKWGLVGLGLWLLRRGLMPTVVAAVIARRIWDGVRR